MSQERYKERSDNFAYDRLYGRIELTDDDLRLLQTKEFSRLKDLSLSAAPPRTIMAVVCASKAEHSIGTYHLAKIATRDANIRFAALAHDFGTPPFSHVSESFMKMILGVDHEEFVDEFISEGSQFRKELKRQGADPVKVSKLIKGQFKPESDFINGSIDLDNLDNSLRYGLSMGIFQDKIYSPERLARSFSYENSEVYLKSGCEDDLLGWEFCRKRVYGYVYSPQNLASGSMLWRAIYFAQKEGEIDKEFFKKTDSQAFYDLIHSNQKAKSLMEKLERWQHYKSLINFQSEDIPEGAKPFFLDPLQRGILADQIAEEVRIKQEQICIYMGKDKGFKKIGLRIEGSENYFSSILKPTWLFKVFIDPEISDKSEAIKKLTKEKLCLELRGLRLSAFNPLKSISNYIQLFFKWHGHNIQRIKIQCN